MSLHSETFNNDFDVRLLHRAPKLERLIIVDTNFDESKAVTDVFAEAVVYNNGRTNISFNEKVGLEKRKYFRNEFNRSFEESRKASNPPSKCVSILPKRSQGLLAASCY